MHVAVEYGGEYIAFMPQAGRIELKCKNNKMLTALKVIDIDDLSQSWLMYSTVENGLVLTYQCDGGKDTDSYMIYTGILVIKTALENGGKVTHIKARAFNGNTHFTRLVLPEYLEVLYDGVFANCSKLEEVILPEGLRHIGNAAFSGTNIKEIIIPGTVQTINDDTFKNCASLRYATIEEGVTIVSDGMFESCRSLERVYIPSTVTEIGASAFRSCVNVYDMSFGGTVEQWDAITKGNYWDTDLSINRYNAGKRPPIVCSNGVIPLD